MSRAAVAAHPRAVLLPAATLGSESGEVEVFDVVGSTRTLATPRAAGPGTASPGTATPDLDEQVEERVQEPDAGDHDRFAHYVRKRDLERFHRTGKPIRALCGKRWKPERDPSQYPMCPTCSELIAEAMSRGLSS